MSGKYLGLQPLTTQLDLCSNLPLGTEGNPPEFLKIGHGVFRECSVNISTLLLESTAPRQLFYDLYIVDSRADCASVGADDAQLGRSDKPRGALSRSKTFFPRSVCGGDFEENTSDVTPRARKTR